MSLESWKEMCEVEAKHTPLVGQSIQNAILSQIFFQDWCTVGLKASVAEHIMNSDAWSYAYTDEVFALTKIKGRKIATYLYWKDGRTEELHD